jgi:hypothetical protein
MEGLAAELLQPVEIDAVLAIEVNVFARKIIAYRANEVGRGEKTRGHGGVAGGPAKESRIFRVRGFNGIKGGGADY